VWFRHFICVLESRASPKPVCSFVQSLHTVLVKPKLLHHYFASRMTDSSSDFRLLADDVSIVAVDGSSTAPSSRPPAGYGRARRSWRRSPSEMSTSYQPVDWASDDGVRFDGRPLRRTVSDSVASSSDFGVESRNLKPSASLPPRGPSRTIGNVASSSSIGKATTPKLTLLHGKNILQIMAIGSIEPIARDSNSVDWSDSLGVVDEAEDMSLMDPHYDLTSARMMKLFSLFNPEGEWVEFGVLREGEMT
jgi:hypothetical protein